MNKPKYTVYLKKQSFDLIDEKDKILSFEFSPEACKNTEILNADLLKHEVGTFITDNNLAKEDAIIILAEDLIFEKVIDLTDKKINEKEEEKSFMDIVPIKNDNITQKTIVTNDVKILLAVDKNYFTTVKKAFEKQDIKVVSVLPQNPFFHPEKNKTVNPAILSIIYDNDDLIKKADLLSFNVVTEEESKEEKEEPKEKETTKKAGSLIFGIILIIIIGALMIGVGSYLFINKPWVKETPKPEATEVPITTEETATPAATLAKKDINIEILNKTKTAGLAGKVEEKLIGYGDIKTGNTTSTDSATTEVVFSASISADIKAEIETLLTKMFSKVTTPEGVLPKGFDILIKTGAESL